MRVLTLGNRKRKAVSEMTQALAPTPEAVDLAPVVPVALDRHPVAVYLAKLAPTGRRSQKQALEVAAGILSTGRCDALSLPWPAVRYQHVAALRARLLETYSPASVNKMLYGVRAVLGECWRLGLMGAEEFHRAADVRNVKAEKLPRGRALAAGELVALFRVCSATSGPAGARDAAILALLYSCGLRRAEATALTVDDVDLMTGQVVVHAGKGQKDRITHATNGALVALAAWVRMRGSEPGPFLNPVVKGGRVVNRAMTAQAVYLALAERGREAGVASFSPHDLRRSFVSDLLDAGADISTVAKLAGHARPETTARYDRRGEAVKARAAGLLHVPFVANPAW